MMLFWCCSQFCPNQFLKWKKERKKKVESKGEKKKKVDESNWGKRKNGKQSILKSHSPLTPHSSTAVTEAAVAVWEINLPFSCSQVLFHITEHPRESWQNDIMFWMIYHAQCNKKRGKKNNSSLCGQCAGVGSGVAQSELLDPEQVSCLPKCECLISLLFVCFHLHQDVKHGLLHLNLQDKKAISYPAVEIVAICFVQQKPMRKQNAPGQITVRPFASTTRFPFLLVKGQGIFKWTDTLCLTAGLRWQLKLLKGLKSCCSHAGVIPPRAPACINKSCPFSMP